MKQVKLIKVTYILAYNYYPDVVISDKKYGAFHNFKIYDVKPHS